MSIVTWNDLPATVEEFVQKYGDVPTVLSGQEQQAVEALRIKAEENNDWQPLYERVKHSIDDIEDDDDVSSVSNSDSDNESDASYDHVMEFNKLLRKNPTNGVLKSLYECLTQNVAQSDDANLADYIALTPVVRKCRSSSVQKQYVEKLDLIVDCVNSRRQDGLDAGDVAAAAVFTRNYRDKKINRKKDDDDTPIAKRNKLIQDDRDFMPCI